MTKFFNKEKVVVAILQTRGNLETPDTTQVYVIARDGDNYISSAKGTTVPTGEAGYAVGCDFIDTNKSGNKLYNNVGTTSVADWDLIGEIDSGDIAAGAVDNAAIGTDAVDSDEIKANAVGASEIATDAVGSDEIATDAVDSAEIKASAVGSSEIATDAVGSDEIATDAVDSAEIKAGAVGTSEIATDGVGADEIAADAVGASELADNAVDNAAMADNAVGNAEMADNAIGNAEMADNAIGNAEMADNAIGKAEMADNAVGSAEIEDDSVTPNDVGAALKTDLVTLAMLGTVAEFTFPFITEVRTEQTANFCKAWDEGTAAFVAVEASSGSAEYTANYQLFPDTPVQDDAVYFGKVTPFGVMYFDLSATAATYGANSIVWLYWNGTTWSPLTIIYDRTDATAQDGQRPFQNDGHIIFSAPSDWVPTTIDGQQAFWVRAVCIGSVNFTQVPLLDSHLHYTITAPLASEMPANGTTEFADAIVELNVVKA